MISSLKASHDKIPPFRVPIHVMHNFLVTLNQNESIPILIRELPKLRVKGTRRCRCCRIPSGIDTAV